MEKNNIFALVIALVVGIILAGSVLMPVMNTYDEPTRTYINEGIPFELADPNDTDTHTIIVDANGITSDGISVGSDLFVDYTIVFGEHSIIRYTSTTGRVAYGGIDTSESSGQNWIDLRSGDTEQVLTITISGDSLTAVNGTTTKTIEDQWAFISTEGNYRYTLNPCVTSTDRIIGGGVTYSPFSSATVICFDGTTEGINAGVYRYSPTVTIDDITVNTSTVTTNLLKIDSIVFDCTQSDTDKTATYTYFLAPEKITYNNPEYMGNNYATLLGAIPIMVIVALLMLAVGAIALRRAD